MKLKQIQLQELKNVELDILKAVAEVCKRLNIKYYVCYGTLLGAVRHQGFIPWDDDIDIMMLREDYDIFVKEAPKLLPDHMFIQNIWTDKGYLRSFAKVRNSNTAFVEHTVRKRNMNHGVYIDIFVLDYFPEDPVEQVRLTKKVRWYDRRISAEYTLPHRSIKNRVASLLVRMRYPSCHAVLKKQEELYRSLPKTSVLADFGEGKPKALPVEWFGEGVMLPFEDMEVCAPKEYHKLLTEFYGDYMTPPPKEQRYPSHSVAVFDLDKSYKAYMKK